MFHSGYRPGVFIITMNRFGPRVRNMVSWTGGGESDSSDGIALGGLAFLRGKAPH